MATLQLPASDLDELAARARQVSFGRLLLTLFLGIFYVLGLVAGYAWIGVVMCAFSVRRGWRESAGVPAPRHAASKT